MYLTLNFNNFLKATESTNNKTGDCEMLKAFQAS